MTNDAGDAEAFDLLQKRITDLLDQCSGLPRPQLRALLQELLRLVMEQAENLGLDSELLLQQAIDKQQTQ
jgi:hypothetical protein